MTNARYLATLRNGTPALRYAKDRKGNNWTWTKADAYKFQSKGEAELAALNGHRNSGGIPDVQQAPIAPHTRQHRQSAS